MTDLNFYINFIKSTYINKKHIKLLRKISNINRGQKEELRASERRKLREIREMIEVKVKKDLFFKKEDDYNNEDLERLTKIVDKILTF